MSNDNEQPKRQLPKSTVFTKKVGSLQINSGELKRLSLGEYSDRSAAKGFSVDISPEPDMSNLIETNIVTISKNTGYELVLLASNYSTTPVTVEVWSM